MLILHLQMYVAVTGTNISIEGVIGIQTAITKDCQLAVALKFTVHVVQSFIKGHRKSGVISIKHSRDNYNDSN